MAIIFSRVLRMFCLVNSFMNMHYGFLLSYMHKNYRYAHVVVVGWSVGGELLYFWSLRKWSSSSVCPSFPAARFVFNCRRTEN